MQNVQFLLSDKSVETMGLGGVSGLAGLASNLKPSKE